MDADMYLTPRRRLRIPTRENRQNARVLRRRGGTCGNGSAGAGVAEPTAAAETRPAILAVETGELAVPDNEGSVSPTPGVEPLDPVQKKVRNLNRKVRASLASLRSRRMLTQGLFTF
jgi:hypothetical protein